MKLPDHGANPHRLYEQAGQQLPGEVLDFSENVHPFGPPPFVKEQWPDFFPLLSAYPDPEAEPFRSACASFHGLAKEQVKAGNGAAEIFTWLARRYRNKRVLLIEPAFSEYRSTLESEGAQIMEYNLDVRNSWRVELDELRKKSAACDAVYLCNPQNPTGRLLRTDELREIAEFCRGVCEVVIDEAFIDFVGEHASFAAYLDEYPHVLIVRSMTKMYALPGLRLGYIMAEPSIIRRLAAGAAHWNVNALAAFAGAQCFSEAAYRERVMGHAKAERRKMENFLAGLACPFIPSEANFLCFRLPDPKEPEAFFRAMLKKGLVLRHTYSFRGMDGDWFRIGMKSATAMERLRKEMGLWLKAH